MRVWLWRKLRAEKLMLLNCGVGEDSWESLGLQGDPTNPSWRRSVLGVHWKDWCWSRNSNTLATSCKELTRWKRPWCWEGLGAGGEGMTENEMAEWYHRLDGHEFESTPGVCNGQGGLACYGSWGHKESDMIEWLNWTELNWSTFWLYEFDSFRYLIMQIKASQVALVVKNMPASAGDVRDAGFIAGSGRLLGGGHGNRL